jgi:hypothetical protein
VSKPAIYTRLSIKTLSLFVILLLALLCVGCGQDEEQVSPTATVAEEGSTTTESPLDSPIPTPGTSTLDLAATPEAGKANLRGRIVITEETYLLGELYLAAAVPTSDPDIYLLELDEENSPRALLDRNTWDFVFLNVEPGKYGLIAWEPMQASPISDSETGDTLYIDLAAGDVQDIGILFFPNP